MAIAGSMKLYMKHNHYITIPWYMELAGSMEPYNMVIAGRMEQYMEHGHS